MNVKIVAAMLGIGAVLFVAACDNPESAVKKLQYFKDTRTGLCFGSGEFYYSGHVSSVFTYVPCEKIPQAFLKEI